MPEELNAVNYRGYMRDEVYAFDIVFFIKRTENRQISYIPGPP
ncbi:MAG: hypothetical protein CM15mV19_1310 [uncultured marine virus]|nr:MAG: hypothetical protein CM15mV19_1310 [uncultured marine virus]